jgi:D-beta-D-heptose 7-phosphate kinase/D-beta-D-heptose 1-phosphate adenosyltransferase
MPAGLLSRARLAALLDAAPAQRVVIVGDAMLDVYLRGDVERISPEAPVPVVRVRERRDALGGAANVAQNVAALGAGCALVAAVGAGRAGERLRDALGCVGVDPSALVAVDRPTTTKTRVLARGQQVVRFDEEEDTDLPAADAERVLATVRRTLVGATAVVLEDYNKGVLTPEVIEGTIRMARAAGLPVVVDPKFRNFFAFRGATIFKPNRRELEGALGAAVDLEHPEALPATLARLGAEHLLLTLGEDGMALLSGSDEPFRVPTTAREVYDVVGAGDTVTAYLAVMLGAGATPQEAAVVANLAAGVQVGKLGSQAVNPLEVLEAYDAVAAGALSCVPVNSPGHLPTGIPQDVLYATPVGDAAGPSRRSRIRRRPTCTATAARAGRSPRDSASCEAPRAGSGAPTKPSG